MPARNRVTPLGDLVAIPQRGTLTGNRGILHEGREIVRFHGHDAWVTCALEFRGRHSEQWLPRRFTWLYFLDEAVALAAGHRPCGQCRYRDYKRYQSAWADAYGLDTPPGAKVMNRQLHAERLVRGTRRRRLHEADPAMLPDGAFVLHDGTPWLIRHDEMVEWTITGYGKRQPRQRLQGRNAGTVTVITPPSSLAVLRAGYPVQLHESQA